MSKFLLPFLTLLVVHSVRYFGNTFPMFPSSGNTCITFIPVFFPDEKKNENLSPLANCNIKVLRLKLKSIDVAKVKIYIFDWFLPLIYWRADTYMATPLTIFCFFTIWNNENPCCNASVRELITGDVKMWKEHHSDTFSCTLRVIFLFWPNLTYYWTEIHVQQQGIDLFNRYYNSVVPLWPSAQASSLPRKPPPTTTTDLASLTALSSSLKSLIWKYDKD